jgi:16S rRNA (guanine966-N2)-methyltransferase
VTAEKLLPTTKLTDWWRLARLVDCYIKYNMRIIGGRLRGRRLSAPKGLATRPATDRVRESIFNLIGARKPFDGAEVLDLFCGTGALGLEAVSRGAVSCTFVELQRSVIKVARENAGQLGVTGQCEFIQRDAQKFTRRITRQFDLVFADPPYDLGGLLELPDQVRPLLNADGLFLLEHDRHLNFDEVEGWVESRAYGRTIVSIFRPIREDQ